VSPGYTKHIRAKNLPACQAEIVPGREKNLPVNVRVIIANIFPENICPFKSVPWLVKTYTDKKSAYVTDTYFSRKTEKQPV